MIKLLVTQAVPEEYVDIRLPNVDIVRIYTGIGKVLSAFRLTDAIHKYHPDMVVNVGTAGSIIHSIGDIVICSHFVDRDLRKLKTLNIPYHIDLSHRTDAFKLDWSFPVDSVCDTGDSFVTVPMDVEGDVADMEAYAQAQVCDVIGLPFIAVKYVTDIIGQNSVKLWQDKLADARRELSSFFNRLA